MRDVNLNPKMFDSLGARIPADTARMSNLTAVNED
jgi:hypothetical protein